MGQDGTRISVVLKVSVQSFVVFILSKITIVNIYNFGSCIPSCDGLTAFFITVRRAGADYEPQFNQSNFRNYFFRVFLTS